MRGSRQQLVLVGIVAVAALVVAGTLAALAVRASVTTAPAATSSTIESPPAVIVLPLELADVGFEGTVTDLPRDEGPDAVSYCNNTPETTGLIDWDGNVMTEADGRRRVLQLLARFRSSVDASSFVASNTEIADCATWETADAGGGTVTFTMTEADPTFDAGDESRQFDLTATTDGPDLFLRVILTRSGRDVLQVTYVSANRQDLDQTGRLVARAAEIGGL